MKKPSSMSEWLLVTVGSAFGLGLAPIAPGSLGALLGIGLHALGVRLSPMLPWQTLGGIFLVVCAVHFMLTPVAGRYWNDSDPKNFVLDEVAGYLLMAMLTTSWVSPPWIMIEGFLLFRVLDIIKPSPAREIDENMHNAIGVLLDDLVAAVYAAGLLLGQQWLVNRMAG